MVDEVYKIHTRNDVCEIELKKVMNHRECHIVRNKEGKIKIVDLEKYDIKITDKRGRSIEGSVIGNFDEDKLKSNDKRYMDAVCVDYFDDGMRLLQCMTDYGGYLGELEKDETGKYRVTRIEEVKNKYKGQNSITNTIYEKGQQEYTPKHGKKEEQEYVPKHGKKEEQEYVPKHGKKEEQEYVPRHGKKEEQEYIPRHGKKEEQEYVPRHGKKEEQKYVPRHAQKEKEEVRRRYNPSNEDDEKEI